MVHNRTPIKKNNKTNIQSPTNSWVILLKGEASNLCKENNGKKTATDIVNLRHPNTGKPALFLFTPAKESEIVSIQEIVSFNEGKRSWFVDDTVKSDGTMYLSTSIDPLFLVLPYLRKSCLTQAVPLDQFLQDEEFPETGRIIDSDVLKYLDVISDRKGTEDLKAFKYNEEKTLLWLKIKIQRVAQTLKEKNIFIATDGKVSASFIVSSRMASDDKAYLTYACEMISEYLTDDLAKKLREYLDLQEDSESENTQNLKRKNLEGTEHEQDAKKMRIQDRSADKAPSKMRTLNKSPVKISSKDRARMKAACGSKSINLFFKVT